MKLTGIRVIIIDKSVLLSIISHFVMIIIKNLIIILLLFWMLVAPSLIIYKHFY